MPAPRLAFFDVDHTLTRRATGLRFAALAIKRKHVRARDLAAVPLHWLRYRLGLPAKGQFQNALIEVPPLAGLSRAVLEELARECFETKIGEDLYPPAFDLIKRLEAAGTRIILATSSLDFIVRPLADYLGAHDMLASSLEFDGDVTTGRLLGGAVFGAQKLAAARELASRLGYSLEEAAFYSDSIHDLPLLKAVAMPCAVNPDPMLRRAARKEGWDILDFRRGR